jgi:hypothetical protein
MLRNNLRPLANIIIGDCPLYIMPFGHTRDWLSLCLSRCRPQLDAMQIKAITSRVTLCSLRATVAISLGYIIIGDSSPLLPLYVLVRNHKALQPPNFDKNILRSLRDATVFVGACFIPYT